LGLLSASGPLQVIGFGKHRKSKKVVMAYAVASNIQKSIVRTAEKVLALSTTDRRKPPYSHTGGFSKAF
jgi:hypothetical protein